MKTKRQLRAQLLAEIQAASNRFQAICQTLGEEDLSADDLRTIKANLMILRGTRVSLDAEIATLEDRFGEALSTGAPSLNPSAWPQERASTRLLARL